MIRDKVNVKAGVILSSWARFWHTSSGSMLFPELSQD